MAGSHIDQRAGRVPVAGKSSCTRTGLRLYLRIWASLARPLRCLVERRRTVAGEEIDMLWTIFVVLLVLWALGMVSSYTIGGFIHILLVIAIAVVLIRIIQGRRPV